MQFPLLIFQEDSFHPSHTMLSLVHMRLTCHYIAFQEGESVTSVSSLNIILLSMGDSCWWWVGRLVCVSSKLCQETNILIISDRDFVSWCSLEESIIVLQFPIKKKRKDKSLQLVYFSVFCVLVEMWPPVHP